MIGFTWPFFRLKKSVILFRITQKLILGIVLFYRQDRGVLNTPHMYLYFWSYVSFWAVLMERIQYAPTEIPNMSFFITIFRIKKKVMPFRITIPRFKYKVDTFCIGLYLIKRKVMLFCINFALIRASLNTFCRTISWIENTKSHSCYLVALMKQLRDISAA